MLWDFLRWGDSKDSMWKVYVEPTLNPLNAELNPICYLLALLAHHFLHVSRIRINVMYIYGAPILDVSRSHTTTRHSR